MIYEWRRRRIERRIYPDDDEKIYEVEEEEYNIWWGVKPMNVKVNGDESDEEKGYDMKKEYDIWWGVKQMNVEMNGDAEKEYDIYVGASVWYLMGMSEADDEEIEEGVMKEIEDSVMKMV